MISISKTQFAVLGFVMVAVLLIPVNDAFADHTEVAIVTVDESGFSQTCAESNGGSGCYTPVTATVDVGGVVTMTNTDPTGVHTFTSGTVDGFAPSPDGTFDTGVMMSGDAFEWTPTQAGEQPYYCMLHTWMIGTIIVQEAVAEEVEDTAPPVITIPELTTDQWGNKNLELSMSGTTNFPTGSWTLDVTDNVGVVDSACWTNLPYSYINSLEDPWEENTQSYDFSKITNPPNGQKFPIGPSNISCAAYDAAGNRSESNFRVVVTHDDPTGLVQYIDLPNSFGNTADSTTKIFYSANSAQGLHLLKPIADLLTASNTQGMLARQAEWTLLDGAITIKDDPVQSWNPGGSFYARMSGDGYDREIAKPLATMLTDANMAGMLERNNPDRSWTSGSNTITISESSGNFAAMVKICSPSGGGTSCQENHVLKPFADMLNESNLNQAMFERSNMKILDAGGPAASAPQSSSSADTTPPVITHPLVVDLTVPYSGWFPVTSESHPHFGLNYTISPSESFLSATDDVDGNINDIVCRDLFPGQESWITIYSGNPTSKFLNFMNTNAGSHPITCTATDSSGNIGSASFTIEITEATADTTPPVVSVPNDVTIIAGYPILGIQNFPPTATDDVDGNLTTICNDGGEYWNGSTGWSSYLNWSVGVHPIVCSATDSNGNQGSASFTIIITGGNPADTTSTSTNSTSTISGKIWEDYNGNGIYDSSGITNHPGNCSMSSEGIGDVRIVRLTDSNGQSQEYLTHVVGGDYTFTNLISGELYTVTYVNPWPHLNQIEISPFVVSVTLSQGETKIVNFGMTPAFYGTCPVDDESDSEITLNYLNESDDKFLANESFTINGNWNKPGQSNQPNDNQCHVWVSLNVYNSGGSYQQCTTSFPLYIMYYHPDTGTESRSTTLYTTLNVDSNGNFSTTLNANDIAYAGPGHYAIRAEPSVNDVFAHLEFYLIEESPNASIQLTSDKTTLDRNIEYDFAEVTINYQNLNSVADFIIQTPDGVEHNIGGFSTSAYLTSGQQGMTTGNVGIYEFANPFNSFTYIIDDGATRGELEFQIIGDIILPTILANHTITIVEESGFSQDCVDTGCYTPSTLTVDVGNLVNMTNTDPTGVHTFTSGTVDGFTSNPNGAFDSGVLMPSDSIGNNGGSFEWTPTSNQDQPYYCMLHTWMVGTIVVGDVDVDDNEAAAAAEAAAAEAAAAEAAAAEAAAAEAAAAEAAAAEAAAAEADTTPPTLTQNQNITLDATTSNGAIVNYESPIAINENYGLEFGPTCTPASGSFFQIGTTEVTCSASDLAGNVGTTSFTVTVNSVIAAPVEIITDVSITIGKSQYNTDEAIFVTGIATPFTENNVSIQVEDSLDNVVLVEQITPESSGVYTGIIFPNFLWSTSGNYTMSATYGNSTANTSFGFEFIESVIDEYLSPTGITLQTDTSMYAIGDTITIESALTDVGSDYQIGIFVEDPTGELRVIQFLNTDDSGSVSLSLKAQDNWIPGKYFVIASDTLAYDTLGDSENTLESVSFDLVKPIPEITISPTITTTESGNTITSYDAGDMAYFSTSLLSESTSDVLVTINVVDADDTTLGVAFFKSIVGKGDSELVLGFKIPEDAADGAAKIYVNTYTDWIDQGGIVIGSELLSEVNIDGVIIEVVEETVVEETVLPENTIPRLSTVTDITQSASFTTGSVVSYSLPRATSGATTLDATCTPAPGSMFPIGSTQVTCTATNEIGNTGMTSFMVTINPILQTADQSLSVKVGKDLYNNSEPLFVTGSVGTATGEPINLEVRDTQNNLISIEQVTPKESGVYSAVLTSNELWDNPGEYTIIAKYEGVIALDTFEFKLVEVEEVIPEKIPTSLFIDTLDSAYVLGDVVAIGVNLVDAGAGESILLEIKDSQNDQVLIQSLNTDSDGIAVFLHQLDSSGEPGVYSVTAVSDEWSFSNSQNFVVVAQIPDITIGDVISTLQDGTEVDSFESGDMGYFQTPVISESVSNVLITVNIFDVENTPLGLAHFNSKVVDDTFDIVLGLQIPEDAAPGLATVYINTYTDWPNEGGVPILEEQVSFIEISPASTTSLTVSSEEPEPVVEQVVNCGPGTENVNGICETPITGNISVNTESTSYATGNSIVISGYIKNLAEYEQPVVILIVSPDGNLVTIDQVSPDSSGNYSTTVTAGGTMNSNGEYEVRAQYGASKITSTFSFASH